jgi:hypothetical protein
MKMRLITILFLLLSGTSDGQGQEIVVHFDKPYYLAGEYVFYTMAFSDPRVDSAFVVRIEIANNLSSLGHHFVTVAGSVSRGYFRVPYDVKSDFYYFNVDLYQGKSYNTHQILQYPLAIYNSSDAHELNAGDPGQSMSASAPPGVIDILLEDEPNHTRQRIGATVRLEQPSLVSILIRDKSLYHERGSHTVLSPYNTEEEAYLNGIPIFGKRIPPDDAISNPLFFAANVSTLDFSISMVGNDSLFSLALPTFHGEQNIDFIDYVWDDAIVEIAPYSRSYPELPLTINAEVKANLELNEERRKIYGIYNSLELVLPFTFQDPLIPDVESDYEVDVADFAIQGTLLNLFKEILAPLKFRRAGEGRQRARMIYDAEDGSHFYNSKTKFIVNDQVTRDGNYIANIPIQEVEYITIYHDLEKVRKNFGPIGTGGIVVIDMKDKTFSLPDEICMPDHPIQGLQREIEYPIEVSEIALEPQLKSTLFWKPFTPTDGEGKLQFEFTTSDDLSDFEIIAIGIDSQGQMVQGTRSFQITRSKSN